VTTGSDNKDFDFLKRPISRRNLLKGAAAIGGAFALGPVMSACGGGGGGGGTAASPTGAAKKGGILKVGIPGGQGKDTADPHMAPFVPDDAINWLMFEGLAQFSPDYKPELLLAEEITPNSDATVWTVRLKPDIPWQDGRTVSADDVVFTFQRICDPDNPLDGASAMGGLKPENVKKVDDLTVTFTYDEPFVLFATDAVTQRLVHIVPVDFDPKNPIGTGPFQLVDFKPGDRFGFTGFKDYHGGAPYLDEVSLIQFPEETARVNAFVGGTVDAIAELPHSQVTAIEGAGLVPLNAKSGGWMPFCMRIDREPFTDVRVRQAFRLIPDRQRILDNAFNGIGWIANDMYSPFDQGYPKDLPQRQQDLEQAKSLLKQARYEDLSIEVVTSDAVGAGAVAAAQIFAENAKGAGVNVKVNKVDGGIIYGDDYLSWTFSMDFWGLRNYLQQALSGCTPDAPYNETHWKNDQWYTLIKDALRTVDDGKRNELVGQAATIEYEEGGYIINTFKNQLDAYSDNVTGIVTNDVMGIPLGRWRFHKVAVG
jgi:peptide/nickel transport system substrate-binding protein